MSRTLAIAGRELRSFLTSPTGFVVAAFFLLISSFFFNVQVQDYAIASLEAARNPALAERLSLHDGLVRPFCQTIAFLLLLVVPIISMRLLAEEKRQGTAELLLTAPLRTSEVVLGKFLGALGYFTLLLALTLQYPLLLRAIGSPLPTGAFLSAFLGVWLMGAALLSVGLLMSSLTESQVIAAVASTLAAVFLWVVGFMEILVGETAGRLFRSISLLDNMDDLNKGIVDTGSLVFFVTFAAFNLFLTQRVVDSRRWR